MWVFLKAHCVKNNKDKFQLISKASKGAYFSKLSSNRYEAKKYQALGLLPLKKK